MGIGVKQDNKRVFIIGSAASYLNTIITAILGLVQIPIGLNYFGTVTFGLWLIISTIMTYLSLSQFGIGTVASVLIAKTTDDSIQRGILRHSIILLTILAFISFIVFEVLTWYFPNWIKIFGEIDLGSLNEVSTASMYIIVLYLLRLPTVAFISTFTGLQKIYVEKNYNLLNTILSFFALILVTMVKGTLVTLAIYTGIANLVVGIISGVHLYMIHPNLRMRIKENYNSSPSILSILIDGSKFFLISIAAMIVWSTDNIIINYFLGPEHVSIYVVSFKLFYFGYIMFVLVNGVITPMYGRASSLNQWEWIHSTYKLITTLSPIFGGLLWIGGICFTKNIVSIWVGSSRYGGDLVIYSLGAYGYFLSLVNCHASILTGLNSTKRLIWAGWAEAIVNLCISLTLVKILGIGGVALGTALGSLFTVLWILPLEVSRQTSGKVRMHYHFVYKHSFFILVPSLLGVYFIDNYITLVGSFVFIIKVVVILFYLIFSWKNICPEKRDLIKVFLRSSFLKLRVLFN